MVTRRPTRLVPLLVVLLLAAGAAAEPPSRTVAPAADSTRIGQAVQDGTGRVWALVLGQPGENLRWWDGAGWRRTPTPTGVSGRAESLAATPGGAVICLWDEGKDGLAVTAHRGAFVRMVAHVPDPPPLASPWNEAATDSSTPPVASVLVDQNDLWLADPVGDLMRVDLRAGHAGQVERAWRMDPSQYYPSYSRTAANGTGPMYASFSSLVDPLGRTWFWGDAEAMDGLATLRGVLIWDGRRMTALPTLQGLPDTPIDSIAVHDAGHLWIAAHQKGIYSLDLHTMSVVTEIAPAPGAFDDVQRMFAVGPDWYVIAGSPNRSFATPDNPAALTGVLWRWHSGGWAKLLPGLDRQGGIRSMLRRPLLATDLGLWIGAYGYGAWLLPTGASTPRHLDWRVGYAPSSTDCLFALPPARGGVLAVELFNFNSTASVTTSHLEMLALRPQADPADTLVTGRPLVQDARRHLWNVVASPVGTLNEWDGGRWHAHALPPGASAAGLVWLCMDSRQRVWLMMDGGVPGTPGKQGDFIYDPATGRWGSGPDYPSLLVAQAQALQAQQTKPGQVPDLRLISDDDRVAVFGSDGRVCYRTNNAELHLYDGQTWHLWRRPDIVHDHGFAFDGPPFFSADGEFAVNINYFSGGPQDPPRDSKAPRVTCRWSADGGWHSGPYERGPHDIPDAYPQPPATPPGAPPADGLSIAQDDAGTVWYTSGRVLYKVAAGQAYPVFAPGEPSPFGDGRRIVAALTDPSGNTFLETDADRHREYVIVRADSPH